ncbi:MAG TPA: GNAT family N-acetyltransferase [Gammaproteobacteria bacterium]|nr:GNAT family N-acetyltransferase [Gammaproteobacteria bacterium]
MVDHRINYSMWGFSICFCMNISIYRSASELGYLSDEWNELLVHSDSNSIFLTWEWMSVWLGIHADKNIFVVAVRDEENRLIGIAPFYVVTMRLLKVIGYKVLQIIGDAESGAEYPDFIVRKGSEKLALDAIAHALESNQSQWDCMWIRRVSGWSGACDRIKYVCDKSNLIYRDRPHVFCGFALPSEFSEYQKGMSKNRKQQLRRQSKKVFKGEDVSVVECRELAEVDDYLNQLFDLSSRRWSSIGLKGAFEKYSRMKNFYREFIPVALEKGWLLLMAIRNGGDLKSIQLGYVYDGNFLQLQEGFDPEYVDGAGNVLRLEVIQKCIEDGVTYYDFLGGSSEHKRRWGGKERFGVDLLAGKVSWKNRILFFKEVWPTGKFMEVVS